MEDERLLCLSERERKKEEKRKLKLGVLCSCVTTWVREKKSIYIYIRVPSGNLRK
jgi:hypothetical protein